MEPINVNLSCDIQQPVKVRYLDGYFFSKDSAGHRINVDVFDNGAPVSVGGSVSAEVVRSDGETVPVTGAVSANRAYVILPQAAYAVVGAVQITIKVTEGTTIVTIACFVAYVHESDTEITVDPGTIIPSVQALISQIETAVASIPADYSSLWTSLAPAFSTSTPYTVGQYVTNSGVLYRFTTAHPAGTWNSAHVTAVNLGAEVYNLKSAITALDNIALKEYDLTNIGTYHINISQSTGKWVANPNHNSYYFEIPNGTKIARIKSSATNGTVYALLSASDTHAADTTPSYATGCTRTFIAAGLEVDIVVPNDCKYIWITKTLSGSDYAPQYLGFNKQIPDVDTTLTKSGEAADAKVTGDKIDEIEKLQDVEIGYSVFGTNGYGINKTTGKRYSTSSAFCTTGNVDVGKYDKITYKRVVIQYATAPTHGMAFYDENNAYISGIGSDYGSEKSAGYEDYTIAVPTDAKYARFTIWADDAHGGFSVSAETILKSNIEKLMAQNTTNDTSSYKWLAGLVGMPQKNNGKFNVAARMRMLCDTEWLPIAPVPRERYVSGNIVYDSFPQGEKQTGIPYGAQLTYEQWIGKNISFETFLSALANPNSVMYDFSRVGTAYRAAAWYSVNCSKSVAWALNLPNVYASGEFASDPHISIVANAGEYTANDIHIGDIIEKIGEHTAFITDLVYNSFGDLSQIEVSEAITPTCRRKRWNVYGSFENFFDVFSGYRLERYDYVDDVPPINMEAMFPYISPSLGLNYGNKSNYVTTDTIEITLLKKVSNTLIVKKDGEQIDTIDVTSVDESAIVEYTQSTPGWYEIGFSGDASKNYVGFCINDNSATFDAETNKLTFASTESTLFMVSYSYGSSRAHLKDVFPTAEDLANGYMILNVPNNADYIHVTFANDYGKTIIEIALT